MKLEQQVISLDLAKRLKELGVSQHSYLYWSVPNPEKAKAAAERQGLEKAETQLTKMHWGLPFDEYAAFTVAELGEFFRKVPYLQVVWMPAWKEDGTQSLAKLVNGETGKRLCDITGEAEKLWEAEARGLLLAYLIENGLIQLDSSKGSSSMGSPDDVRNGPNSFKKQV